MADADRSRLSRPAAAASPFTGSLATPLGVGVLVGLMQVMAAVSYGTLVFSTGPPALVPSGIGLVLLSSAINTLVVSWFTSQPGIVGGTQSLPVAIIAAIAPVIGAGAAAAGAPPEARHATLVAAMAVSSLATAGLMLAMARFRLGRIVRYLPFPVIAGVLAGTGWLLVIGAMRTMTPMPLSAASFTASELAHWLPAWGLALVLHAVVARVRRPFVLPALTVLAALAFHAGMASAGWTLAELGAARWLVGPFDSGSLWPIWVWSDVGQVRWPVVVAHAAALATIPLLSAVALLLNATALEAASGRDLDLDRELFTAGIATMAGGAAGGVTGYQQLGLSMLSLRMGAPHRAVGLVGAVVCAVMVWEGTVLVGLIPKPVVGGLLLYLGTLLIHEWIWGSWRRLSGTDFTVLLMIVGVIVGVGFLQGVALGLAACVVMFALHYGRLDPVRQVMSGRDFHSRVARSPEQRRQLADAGDATCILQLQGYLFFGMADRLLARLRGRIDEPGAVPLRHVVLDFRRVMGMDATAVESLAGLLRRLQPAGVVLVATDVPPAVRSPLAAAGVVDGPGCRLFADLDLGLEWCESRLLPATDGRLLAAASGDPLGWLLDDHRASGLSDHLERLELTAGQVLIAQGDAPDDLYFLQSGQLTAELQRPGLPPVRLQTMRGGHVVGEIGFYLAQPRSAVVKADEPSVVWRLSAQTLRRLETEAPPLAAALHRGIARLMADRVMHLTRVVDATQR